MWRLRTPRWLAGQRLLDVALIVAVVLIGTVTIALNAGRARGYTHLILLSLTLVENSIALLFRRRHPVGSLLGVLAVYAVFELPPTMALPVLVALFTVATLRRGRVVALTAVGTAAVVIGRPYLQGGPVDFAGQQLPLLLGIALAVSLGMYTRLRRAHGDDGGAPSGRADSRTADGTIR